MLKPDTNTNWTQQEELQAQQAKLVERHILLHHAVASTPSSTASTASTISSTTTAVASSTTSSTKSLLLQGLDSNGKVFPTISSIWRAKAQGDWYKEGREYWTHISADISGVLGGQVHVSLIELAASAKILERLIQGRGGERAVESTTTATTTPSVPPLPTHRCLDCGAGIGRVTRGLLSHYFDICDLVEQDKGMLREAVIGIQADYQERQQKQQQLHLPTSTTTTTTAISSTSTSLPKVKGELGQVHISGLQEFTFAPDIQYDLVWLQWVVGCVNDVDFIRFLQKAAHSLTPQGGRIIIKDNCAADENAFYYDVDDSSIARGKFYFDAIFDMAGLEVEACISPAEHEWDPELMRIFTWILRPKSRTEV